MLGFLLPKPKLDERSDEALLAAYKQQGKQKGEPIYNQIFSRYLHRIYGVVLSYLKDQTDAEDATVTLFAKLPDKMLKYEVANFEAWLLKMTRNHCLAIIKKRQKQFTEAFDEKTMGGSVDFFFYEALYEEEALYDHLNVAIDALKPEQKQCIISHYLKGQSYREIADTQSMPLKTVKSHIQNGRLNLRAQLTK